MTDLGGRGAYPRAVRRARQTAGLPPGYPQEYWRLVTLRDGRSVLIRPILPSDAPALAEAIQSADADTIYRRYLGGRPRVTPELLDFLTTVDYTSRFALFAVEPASQRGVAIARWEPAGQDGTAQVAIAVTLGWRDVGLAGELLRMLAQAAGERGIHTFTGTYLADNSPVAALINAADEHANRVTSHGIAEFSVPLRPPDPGPQGRARRVQDLDTVAVLPDLRAERRRRLAEPDLEFRAFCTRRRLPASSTPQPGYTDNPFRSR